MNKDKKVPPSGMPGVQTLMPAMLNHNDRKLSLKQLIFVVESIKIFGIQNKGFIKEGYDADFTIVDMNKKSNKNENIDIKM